MQYRFLLIGILWLAFASPLVAQRPDNVQATLLHNGTAGFIHAVPLKPGHAIVQTVPATGVMKPLLKVQPRPVEAIAAVTVGAVARRSSDFVRRVRQHQGDLIAGATVDDERLYLLTATATYKRPDRPAAGEPLRLELIGHNFHLHAFWLTDGTPIMGRGYQLPLLSEDPKAKTPPDTKKVTATLGSGPLELVDGGVKCRGISVLFDGKRVKKLDIQGKQFTPAPGFFDPRPRIR